MGHKKCGCRRYNDDGRYVLERCEYHWLKYKLAEAKSNLKSEEDKLNSAKVWIEIYQEEIIDLKEKIKAKEEEK